MILKDVVTTKASQALSKSKLDPSKISTKSRKYSNLDRFPFKGTTRPTFSYKSSGVRANPQRLAYWPKSNWPLRSNYLKPRDNTYKKYSSHSIQTRPTSQKNEVSSTTETYIQISNNSNENKEKLARTLENKRLPTHSQKNSDDSKDLNRLIINGRTRDKNISNSLHRTRYVSEYGLATIREPTNTVDHRDGSTSIGKTTMDNKDGSTNIEKTATGDHKDGSTKIGKTATGDHKDDLTKIGKTTIIVDNEKKYIIQRIPTSYSDDGTKNNHVTIITSPGSGMTNWTSQSTPPNVEKWDSELDPNVCRKIAGMTREQTQLCHK